MPPLFFGRYQDIAKEIAERLEAGRGTDPFQPWSEEVIVASSGMADAIARELRPVAALRLQSLENLARRILNDAGEYPHVATDAERRLAMRSAARSIDHPLTTTRGIAAMLERSYRDVRDSGLTLDDLRKRSERARIRNRDRTRVVIRAFTEYERLIDAIGAIDPADLFTRAANVKCETPQIIAGFYDMTGVQLRFVKSLKVSAIYVPTTEKFAEPFVTEFGNLSPQSSVLSPWDVVAYDRADLEIKAIADQVKKLNGKIGIVTRSLDPYDVHLFNRYGIASKQDTPLIAHCLGRTIVTILRLRERGFPRGDVLEIVRDGFRAETSIDIDEADRKTREKRIAGGTSKELRSAQRRPRAVDDYIALVAELESLTAKLDAPLRGNDWSELLATIVSRFKFEDERDLRAAEEVDKVIALFERADRMNVRFDATTVIDALEQIAMTDDVEGAVWIGDVMKFRGRTFDHVFAFHMQDDSFPQRRIEDALLPDSDRSLLGIRQIGDGSDEERLLFRLLFDGADHVHFSFAASDGFGKALRPSQLLKNFVIEQRPGEKAALLKNFAKEVAGLPGSQVADRQLCNPATRQLQLLARAGTRSVFDGFITDPAPFARALETVTPTQLEDFGECPQKFLFEHILGVDELDDPERELQINHRDKGSIDHRILERFYSAMTADDYDAAQRELPMLPESLVSRLNDTVDGEFDRLESEAPPFNRNIRAIERSATKRILRDFVARDLAELIANDLRPQHFEYTFGAKFAARGYRVDHPEPFIVHAAGIPIRVEGKIDRVDQDGSRFRIVDYKSGKALRHKDLGKKIDRGVRLQLAVYAMAIAEFFGAEPSDVSGTIKPIVAGDTNASSFAFDLKDKRWGLQETLDIFASAILRGRFPAFPNEKDADFNSCKYCAVNHSCRTKHDLEEKYAVTRSREPRTLLQEIE